MYHLRIDYESEMCISKYIQKCPLGRIQRNHLDRMHIIRMMKLFFWHVRVEKAPFHTLL